MKIAYPIILTPDEPGYLVYVPDMDVMTEGSDLADALYMAKDLISLCGITKQDNGEEIPPPSTELPKCKEGEMVNFVLVDFNEYRRANDQKAIRRSVSLPNYLNHAAEKAGLNFSRLLQDAIKEKLGIA